jgi:hypothetical protein
MLSCDQPQTVNESRGEAAVISGGEPIRRTGPRLSQVSRLSGRVSEVGACVRTGELLPVKSTCAKVNVILTNDPDG